MAILSLSVCTHPAVSGNASLPPIISIRVHRLHIGRSAEVVGSEQVSHCQDGHRRGGKTSINCSGRWVESVSTDCSGAEL